MMTTAEEQRRYMLMALELARRAYGRTSPNPAVGAVIVRDGQVVGRGFHPKAGEPHAEIFALRDAAAAARGADVYVTLEPCSHQGRTGPCCDALIAAGVARVFVGVEDPNPLVSGRGIARLRAAGIAVKVGICAAECRHLIAPFARHVTSGRPLVTVKGAISLDGCIATAAGESQWISGPASRQHAHRQRGCVDAIMVGVGTVISDNPRLTARVDGGRDPLRVVVDSTLRIPADAVMLSQKSSAATVIATTELADPAALERLRAHAAVEVVVLPQRDRRVDLIALLEYLGQRQVQSVLVEGGATLNAALLDGGLIDRIMLYVAPMIIGNGQHLFAGAGARRLDECLRLAQVRSERFDDDIFIEGEVVSCSPD